MKIERLKFKSGNLFSVTVTDNPPFVLDDISVYKLGLAEGKEVSDELFEEIVKISGQEGAKYAAARMLTAGRKTELEIIQRLRQKGFTDENIKSATELFKKSGVLNDEQYAAAYIKDAVNLKKYSVRQIRMKLMQKGIDRQVISTLAAKLDDFPQLYKLVETQMSKNPDKKDMEKFKRRLCGKGFSLWDINKVVGEFENEG